MALQRRQRNAEAIEDGDAVYVHDWTASDMDDMVNTMGPMRQIAAANAHA